ncbi:uncharacterized protein LOC121310572 [Polyodon spathula]|uniref:uncharacterized protein LOC121310572 n=1 Tax=Polyodon spathula TaxID=7913 RepID=UPI001B7ED05F|nr:uncharacterized protein LOC121310572 [Polyodon spathula]
MVVLPMEPLDLVELLDYSNKWIVVVKAPVYCNYTLLQGSGRTLFITPYEACDVRIVNEHYILTLRYTTSGQQAYVQMQCPTGAVVPTKPPPSTTTPRKPTIPTACRASVMTIELPEGPIEQVAVMDKSNTLVTVQDDSRKCGYSLVHGRGKNIFTAPYTACDVKMLNGNYVLTLVYVTLNESNNLVAVIGAPKTCGYSLKGNGKNILTAPYKACHVKILVS